MSETAPVGNSVSQDLDRLRRERPFARAFVDPFVGLLLARGPLVAALAREDDGLPVPWPDPTRVSQGACLEPRDTFPLRPEDVERTFAALHQVLVDGFRDIRTDLLQIGRAVAGDDGFLVRVARDMLGDRHKSLFRTAYGLGVEARVLGFWAIQMLTPLGMARAQRLAGLVPDAVWNRGYCPICGSWPGFCRTRGDDREMVCSFCGTRWHYRRRACPYCETAAPPGQVYAVPGFERERVAICRRCDHYLAEIEGDDLDGLPPEVAGLALTPLEVLARQSGHKAASMDWRQTTWT